ncbi:MAG: DUF1922 domain-containing protein [Promethearchaeota archaeon]|nr:MAG: DUF1922 domain-containing protein [Candidatus Lokiarchaeota archaeon]
MEDDETGITKDEKPYLIFRCSKCEQYMYVKPTQKQKKCLRCGRTHTVAKLDVVDEVKGMTTAVNRVKELQNTLGGEPNLSGSGEFSVALSNAGVNKIKNIMNESELEIQFYDLLHNLAQQYTKFPYYMIELMAQESQFDLNEVQLFLRKFIKEGVLRQLDHNYYTLL